MCPNSKRCTLILRHICHTEEFIVKGLFHSSCRPLNLIGLWKCWTEVPSIASIVRLCLIYRITWFLFFGHNSYLNHFSNCPFEMAFFFMKNCYDFIINITMMLLSHFQDYFFTHLRYVTVESVAVFYWMCEHCLLSRHKSIENCQYFSGSLHAKYLIRSISWRFFGIYKVFFSLFENKTNMYFFFEIEPIWKWSSLENIDFDRHCLIEISVRNNEMQRLRFVHCDLLLFHFDSRVTVFMLRSFFYI